MGLTQPFPGASLVTLSIPDVLRVETEVVSVTPSRSRPERGMVAVRSKTQNQHGDVLPHSVCKLVVPRRQQ